MRFFALAAIALLAFVAADDTTANTNSAGPQNPTCKAPCQPCPANKQPCPADACGGGMCMSPPPPTPPPSSCGNGCTGCPNNVNTPQCPRGPPGPNQCAVGCTPMGPQPSARGFKRRDLNQICPKGLTSCPVKDKKGKVIGMECLDTQYTLDSCGGCPSTGASVDCTMLEGVADVACVKGDCIISACVKGYDLYEDSECVYNGTARGKSLFGTALDASERIFGF